MIIFIVKFDGLRASDKVLEFFWFGNISWHERKGANFMFICSSMLI